MKHTSQKGINLKGKLISFADDTALKLHTGKLE